MSGGQQQQFSAATLTVFSGNPHQRGSGSGNQANERMHFLTHVHLTCVLMHCWGDSLPKLPHQRDRASQGNSLFLLVLFLLLLVLLLQLLKLLPRLFFPSCNFSIAGFDLNNFTAIAKAVAYKRVQTTTFGTAKQFEP